MWGDRVPEIELFRQYYGRTVTPAVIEQAVLSANSGYMRPLTDLLYETLWIDPHFGSVTGKRVRALASVEPEVVPAKGDGINPEKAALYADIVRGQWNAIPRTRQRIKNLAFGNATGRACLEKVWTENPKGSKARWRVSQLHWIHPRRLSLGPKRQIVICDSQAPGGFFEPRGYDTTEEPLKFISFTPQLFDDYPEREGYGPRGMYFSFFKRFSWRERLVLLEVYGKPWRIVEVDAAANVQEPQLKAAQETADRLGANASAAMPKGVKLNVESPHENAGQIHKDVNQDADDQISKLVLNNTRTTDAKGDGLGGEQSRVHQDAETLTFAADGWDIGDILTEQFSHHVIGLNFGAEELSHAPKIVLRFEQPPDRTKEIDRTKVALSIGVPLKLDEVYERIGFAKPEQGDVTIQQSQTPATGGLPGAAPSTTTTIGKQGANGDQGDGSGTPPEQDPNNVEGGEPAAVAAAHREGERLAALLTMRPKLGEHVCLAAQPESVNGSPDVLVETGVTLSARETAKWTNALAQAVEGLTTAPAIFEALTRAAQGLPLASFARIAERKVMHGAMLGALDSLWERENDEIIQPASFAVQRALFRGSGTFVSSPFDEAVKQFKSLAVVDRDTFEQMSAAAKRRSFTIARLARQELLAAAHAELARQIEQSGTTDGPSFADFSKFVKDRLESAGWTPANPSHVETIYRTNVMNGYGGGRAAEMTQPSVIALRPYGQIRSVQDDRGREAHRKANGTVLPLSSSFFQKTWTPFGFNCRCRIVSRSEAWVKRSGVATDKVPAGLPDEGFDSAGLGSFLRG